MPDNVNTADATAAQASSNEQKPVEQSTSANSAQTAETKLALWELSPVKGATYVKLGDKLANGSDSKVATLKLPKISDLKKTMSNDDAHATLVTIGKEIVPQAKRIITDILDDKLTIVKQLSVKKVKGTSRTEGTLRWSQTSKSDLIARICELYGADEEEMRLRAKTCPKAKPAIDVQSSVTPQPPNTPAQAPTGEQLTSQGQ